MKKKVLAAGFCAALLAGNYAAMQLLGTFALGGQFVPETDSAAAVLTEHGQSGGGTVSYTPTICEEERVILEDIAEREEALRGNTGISNRPMSGSESERMTGLMRGYTRALRLPERSLPLEKTSGAAWYDPATLSYQYPSEEMDDEMLLELIDFDAKLNAVYAERAQAAAPDPFEAELTEEQAVGAAKQAVWQFYAIDPEPYDVYASFLEYEDQRIWDISFFPPNEDLLSDTGKYYQVLGVELDSVTGALLYLDKTENREYDKEARPIQLTGGQASLCENTAGKMLQALDSSPEGLTLQGIYLSEKYPDIVYVVFEGAQGDFWRVALVWPELSASGLQCFSSLYDAEKGLTEIK